MWVGQHHAPAALLPEKKTRYPLHIRLRGSQVRSRRMREISPPPEFDPRTAQPVASRYTDLATPNHVVGYSHLLPAHLIWYGWVDQREYA
jgi:hypothetical protein